MGRSGLILPGDVQRPGGLTIYVPSGYEKQPTMVCRVIVDANGELCGKPFYPGEERSFERHVGDCARRHMDLIRAQSPRTRLPAFDEEAWDPEVSEHMRRVGRRMLEEGRLEVKPSERAGF